MPRDDDDGDDGNDDRESIGVARTAVPAVGTADTLHSGEEPGPKLRMSAKVTAEAGPSTGKKRGPRAVRAGDTLGRYELVEEIGEGGMATVYRARDTQLRRDVALKVLFPHLARREEVVRRFQREARAAAGLEHENILRIYDVGGAAGSDDGEDPPYIVMELIRGRSLLGELEQRGPLLAEIAACIGALLADALAVAHAAGIIHRDIKPANVMVADDGRLLLADFGVARLETEDSLVTKTGAVLGTPAYMSPEQAHGETATARSDLYSVGVTLYQLATGVLPFAGTTAKILASIASGQFVAPIRKRSSVGPDLSHAIVDMMAVDPVVRPASAKQVAEALRAIAIAGGLGNPAAELIAYFADPDAYVATKTPLVVRSVVAHARAAQAAGKLPRAMALADRASALAPEDPEVIALVASITDGASASKTKRFAAVAGGLALLGGGGVAVAYALGAFDAPHRIVDFDLVVDAALDGPLPDATLDAALDAAVVDAAQPLILDAAPLRDAAPVRLKDAATTVTVATLDAVVPLPDAFVATVPPDAAPVVEAKPTAIIVTNDLWCNVEIDGRAYNRFTNKPIKVEPGPHTVVCHQGPGGKSWTKTVEAPAGVTTTVAGRMIEILDITIALEEGSEAIINGVHYKNGAVAKLKAQRYEVVVPGVAKNYLTFTRRCAIHVKPDLACY